MRLIDADALIEDCNILDAWDAKIVKAWCDDQPTAYDVDKVIGGLISSAIHFVDDASIICMVDAIDEVRRGGVDETD